MSTQTLARSTGPGNHLGHVVFISAAAAIGGFLFGYDSSNINGAVLAIQKHFDVGPGATGLTVSSALVGSAVGAWFAGPLSERVGRIRVMQLAAVLFLVSAIGAMFPFAIWDLAVWRLVGGVAIGVASVIGPEYIAEVAPPAYRGRLSSFQQLAIVLGIGVSALVNWVIKELAPAGADGAQDLNGQLGGVEAWQWMLGAAAVPALLYLLLCSIIPESPHFLVASGKVTKARKVLAEIDDGDVDDRIAEIRDNLRSERRPRVRDLVARRTGLLPIVWIGIALAVFQQFVGINVIFYYSDALWHSVGLDTDSLLISMASPVINILGTFIAIAFVDRVGRKPLLLIGSVGMAIGLGVAALSFGNATTGADGELALPGTWGPVALVGANLFVISFAMSWGVMLWVMLGEMFPLRVRAAALSVGTAANWVANWMVTVSFPSMSEWNLSVSYWIYTAFAVISFFFVLRFITETKGRRLEEMG